MQEQLLYLAKLRVNELDCIDKVRGVEAIWDELEDTAKITFYYDGQATEEELENFSVVNTEIIAQFSTALLEEKYIRLDYPKPLPLSDFWGYKSQEN